MLVLLIEFQKDKYHMFSLSLVVPRFIQIHVNCVCALSGEGVELSGAAKRTDGDRWVRKGREGMGTHSGVSHSCRSSPDVAWTMQGDDIALEIKTLERLKVRHPRRHNRIDSSEPLLHPGLWAGNFSHLLLIQLQQSHVSTVRGDECSHSTSLSLPWTDTLQNKRPECNKWTHKSENFHNKLNWHYKLKPSATSGTI